MNVQIFGSSKCFDTKKAERWFKERRIKYQYIDLPKKGFSPGEYRAVRQRLGYEDLVNTKCRAYEDLYMAYITPEAREEKLLEHIRRAVSMEPDNAQYRQVLTNLEEGGDAYRRHAGSYQGYGSLGELCMPLCLCWGAQWCFCPRC